MSLIILNKTPISNPFLLFGQILSGTRITLGEVAMKKATHCPQALPYVESFRFVGEVERHYKDLEGENVEVMGKGRLQGMNSIN